MTTAREKPLSISPGDSTGGSSHTNWKAIVDAASSSVTSDQSREAVAQRYWPVINAFVKRSGVNTAEADDVTQGFIADVLLGRNLLASATPERGKFRALLMASVRNYTIDQLRKRMAASRKPEAGWVVQLEDDTGSVAVDGDPERAFLSAWVVMIIDRASNEVREHALRSGQEMHWDILDRRLLQPCMTGAVPVSTEAFMRQWSLSSAVQVANIVARMKRRFTAALMAQLGQFDEDSESVVAEVSALLVEIGGGRR
ncbi:MAG: sigma-70 family RNA polymerase sigma factor [Phycisphaerales bacterium]|nr:sigma-70 family RNA polymerase sigma factor [Phycisphaerales bacterium]